MLKKITVLGFVLTSSMAANVAFAGADCPAAPRDTWLSEVEMQKMIVNEYGYSISKFKVDDNCYEIYGTKPKGEGSKEISKVEVYFNPVNGEIVKEKIED